MAPLIRPKHELFWIVSLKSMIFCKFGENPKAVELTNAVWDCDSYWAPSRQPSSLFDKLDSFWRKQLTSFSDPSSKALVDKDSTQRNFPLSELGNVLVKYACNVAERVHLVGLDKNHRHRTSIYGDAKSANSFFRKDNFVGE